MHNRFKTTIVYRYGRGEQWYLKVVNVSSMLSNVVVKATAMKTKYVLRLTLQYTPL